MWQRYGTSRLEMRGEEPDVKRQQWPNCRCLLGRDRDFPGCSCKLNSPTQREPDAAAGGRRNPTLMGPQKVLVRALTACPPRAYLLGCLGS